MLKDILEIFFSMQNNSFKMPIYSWYSQLCRGRKSNGCCQGLGGEGDGELVFHGYRVSAGEGEEVLETVDDSGCNDSVSVLGAAGLYTQEWLGW